MDTSALIDSLTGPRRSLPRLTALVEAGHRIAISSLVFYEWRRGPRTTAELAAQEALLPSDGVVAFDGSASACATDRPVGVLPITRDCRTLARGMRYALAQSNHQLGGAMRWVLPAIGARLGGASALSFGQPADALLANAATIERCRR